MLGRLGFGTRGRPISGLLTPFKFQAKFVNGVSLGETWGIRPPPPNNTTQKMVPPAPLSPVQWYLFSCRVDFPQIMNPFWPPQGFPWPRVLSGKTYPVHNLFPLLINTAPPIVNKSPQKYIFCLIGVFGVVFFQEARQKATEPREKKEVREPGTTRDNLLGRESRTTFWGTHQKNPTFWGSQLLGKQPFGELRNPPF